MKAAHHRTLGLLADGAVGEAVLDILARRCPDKLAYVATPSPTSLVAQRFASLNLPGLLLHDTPSSRVGPPGQGGQAPDIVLLAWWPRIVDKRFLAKGQAVTLNMHPSLLPYGRGKDPNFWALAEDEPFGVTIHHVDEGVDSGDIAFQAALATDWTDTGATLYARAQSRLISLFEESLDAILAMEIPRIPQGDGPPARRRADLKPRCQLDIDTPITGRALLNLLRARTFPPYPGWRFTDETGAYEVRVKIEKVRE